MQRWKMTTVACSVIVFGWVAVSSVAAQEILTVDQCVNIALENHGSAAYRLPQALEGYHRSRQGVWSAWGAMLPRISNGYNYNYRRSGRIIFSREFGQFVDIDTLPFFSQSSTSWSTDFSLSQNVFDGGATWYRIAQSYHERASRRELLRSAENNLIFGVKDSYFKLLKFIKLVEVQDAAVLRAEESEKTIRSKYELGSASLSEVLKAEVQLGTERLELIRRENDVEAARALMNTILGRSVDSPLAIADVGLSEPAHLAYDEAHAVALRETPDLLSARATLRSAKNDVGIARAKIFPSLNLSITRLFTPPSKNDLLDFDGRFATWFVGANMNLNIFNSFDRKTSISNARVTVKYAREILEQAEQATGLAVKQAHLGVELARSSRNLAARTEASALEDFKLAEEKYRLGAATILDLLNAQASLTKAQNDKVNTLYDHYIAVANLDKAIGRGR